jgi:hypothetical protein
MTLYVDRLNGVWDYKPSDDPYHSSHPWCVVSKTDHFDHRDFVVGSRQNNASVKFLAPFRRFTVGQKFDFPPEYNKGDKVWIDMEWFQSNAIDQILDWPVGNVGIGGLVAEADGDSFLVVGVKMHVPITKVKRS